MGITTLTQIFFSYYSGYHFQIYFSLTVLYLANCEVNGDFCFLAVYTEKVSQGLHFLHFYVSFPLTSLFFSLMGNIIDKGPSVVFIKDFDGHIFGGFASTSWSLGPQFKGSLRHT